MKALVIGATGIIGNHVARALLDEGIEVRAFSRGVTPALNLEGLDVERFQGDIHDSQSLEKAFQGCEWVFHTAGYYPTHTFHLKEHLKKGADEIRLILKVLFQSSVQRFVYTSSLTTIGIPSYYGQMADETCAYNISPPPHPYFAVKFLMEEEVKKEVVKGLPAVIVNPTGCFGPYELKPVNLCIIPQLIKGKVPAYVEHDMNVVDVADVGRGHVLAAKKGVLGERYILGGHNVKVSWVLQTICKQGGVKPPFFKAPLSAALALAWASEGIGYLFKKIPLFPILGLRFVQYGQHIDISKSKQVLGYKVSPMEDCFRRGVDWFKKIGYC